MSPGIQQNLGIRYATVRRGATSVVLRRGRRGRSSTNATHVVVQTRVAGYVERLAVRAPMERVRKGQALATVFAPDWLGPQNELLALKRAGVSRATRQRGPAAA